MALYKYVGVRSAFYSLRITSKEQKHMKTIIGTDEKYRRNNEKRTPRNEQGLTKRQQDKQNLINEIQSFKNKGMTQREISEVIGKSIRTIKNYWNL